jgi:hypothetical protein
MMHKLMKNNYKKLYLHSISWKFYQTSSLYVLQNCGRHQKCTISRVWRMLEIENQKSATIMILWSPDVGLIREGFTTLTSPCPRNFSHDRCRFGLLIGVSVPKGIRGPASRTAGWFAVKRLMCAKNCFSRLSRAGSRNNWLLIDGPRVNSVRNACLTCSWDTELRFNASQQN